MVDVVAEALAGDRPSRSHSAIASGRFHGMRVDVGRLVAVADERLAERQLVADAVQPAGDRAGEGEVAVRVAAGDAALDPGRRAVADDAEAERAVVDAPPDARSAPTTRAGSACSC